MTIPSDPFLMEQIKNQEAISGTGPSGGFGYHFDFSVPQIAVAIHAGHKVRSELLPYMALTSAQRMFEEDTGTDFMIREQPNALWALDSRAVYDLNRDPDAALPLTPEMFWGTTVYTKTPTPEMNVRSLQRYDEFYRTLGTLITRMLDLHGRCTVYDIHSYNISRQKAKGFESPPVFNLGTAALDRSRWKAHIDSWLDLLAQIALPGIKTTVAENLVFYGKGALCKRLNNWDPRILVLPTEVSKVYMDESTGTIYSDMIKAVKDGLAQAMAAHLS